MRLGLKQIVIVDVMTLAGLFILRVAAGASAVDAHASEWLILCTGMLAAFLPRPPHFLSAALPVPM